jgi:hypothetical protein
MPCWICSQTLNPADWTCPFWDEITGYDTNIHLAVLSRLPIVARRPHTNENFLLDGRRLHGQPRF